MAAADVSWRKSERSFQHFGINVEEDFGFDSLDVKIAERNRGALVDTLNSPTKITAATLIGTIPKEMHILKDGILQKMNARCVWKQVRITLSARCINFSNLGEDSLRDMIPLLEISEITKRKGLPSATCHVVNDMGSNDQDREDEKMHILQICTVAGGYNCGRVYFLRADSGEEIRQWENIIVSMSDQAATRARAGAACTRKSQRIVRRVYHSAAMQSLVALVIVIGFFINIIQTELQVAQEPGLCGAFKRLSDAVRPAASNRF